MHAARRAWSYNDAVRVWVAIAVVSAACGRIGFSATSDSGAPVSCTPDAAPPAATKVVTASDDLLTVLSSLGPGDVVEVSAGTWVQSGSPIYTWNGTPAQPIIVRAAPGARPVITNVAGQNVLELVGSYFSFSGFELTGGDDAVRISADHATLADLQVHALGDGGITCTRNGQNCSNLVLDRIEAYDIAGDGNALLLGCSDGTCIIADSTIEGCYLHDLTGASGDGVLAFGSGLAIRDNVTVNTNAPGIRVSGFASGNRHVIERNLVWNTAMDNGIQIEGQAIVRDNIVLGAAGDGIESTPIDFATNDAEIVHNTVVCGAAGGAEALHVFGWDTSSGQIAANNALYCPSGMAIDANGGAPGALFTANVVVGGANVATGVITGVSIAADLGDPTTAAVYPPAGSALIDAGDSTHSVAYDFNDLPRDTHPDVGAYERSAATNPGWIPVAGFKPEAATCTP